MKKVFFRVFAAILSLTVAVICGEAAIRTYRYLKHGPGQGQAIILDDKLGWRATGNFEFHGQKTDAAGQEYQVDIKTNGDGFRIFGNTRAKDRQKVFFIGDSFTQAVEVSNNKTYYSLLRDAIPIEVFAYGGGGYGTLQEYMILDQYLDLIRPDVVVVQFCSNDFINNHYELERRSRRGNNRMLRPYMTTRGEIEYKLPARVPRIREIVNKHSRFLYFVASRLERLESILSQGSVEDIIEEKGLSYQLFKESVEITDLIIKQLRSRVPTSVVLTAFAVDDAKPYYGEFKRLFRKHGISFMDGVPQAVRRAEKGGVVARMRDSAHWNEDGHRITADVLRKYLEAE